MNAKTRKEIEADFLPLTWAPLQTNKQTNKQPGKGQGKEEINTAK